MQGLDGNLYRTTSGGGTGGVGTVFKISTSGTLTSLHSFDGSDGLNPFAGLVLASDGNFHGTTFSGGNLNLGNVLGAPEPTLSLPKGLALFETWVSAMGKGSRSSSER